MALKLYGVAGSQPVRSVLWLLSMKQIPFELIFTMPGSRKGTKHPDFLERNPRATVPFIEDPSSNCSIAEGAAILTYLASKHKFTDLYPTDLAERAAVDEYLHWHHTNTRSISGAYFAPAVRRDLKFPAGVVELHTKNAQSAFRYLETVLGKQV